MVESYIFIEMGIEHFHPLPILANPGQGARGGSCSLSGPYKVLNPKFRGRSKVVKSGDPPACAPDDSLTGEEEKYNGGRPPVLHACRARTSSLPWNIGWAHIFWLCETMGEKEGSGCTVEPCY